MNRRHLRFRPFHPIVWEYSVQRTNRCLHWDDSWYSWASVGHLLSSESIWFEISWCPMDKFPSNVWKEQPKSHFGWPLTTIHDGKSTLFRFRMDRHRSKCKLAISVFHRFSSKLAACLCLDNLFPGKINCSYSTIGFTACFFYRYQYAFRFQSPDDSIQREFLENGILFHQQNERCLCRDIRNLCHQMRQKHSFPVKWTIDFNAVV